MQAIFLWKTSEAVLPLNHPQRHDGDGVTRERRSSGLVWVDRECRTPRRVDEATTPTPNALGLMTPELPGQLLGVILASYRVA